MVFTRRSISPIERLCGTVKILCSRRSGEKVGLGVIVRRRASSVRAKSYAM